MAIPAAVIDVTSEVIKKPLSLIICVASAALNILRAALSLIGIKINKLFDNSYLCHMTVVASFSLLLSPVIPIYQVSLAVLDPVTIRPYYENESKF